MRKSGVFVRIDSVVADLPCHLNLDSDARELNDPAWVRIVHIGRECRSAGPADLAQRHVAKILSSDCSK